MCPRRALPCFIAFTRSTRELSAGNVPNTMPVVTDTRSVNPSTQGSIAISPVRAVKRPTKLVSMRQRGRGEQQSERAAGER